MIDIILISLVIVTFIILFLFWYAKYTSKSGFSKDENKNDIPDSWEKKFGIIFKLKNFIILILGILIGFLLDNSSLFSS
jgi:Na+/melibiose symporter-like transporter